MSAHQYSPSPVQQYPPGPQQPMQQYPIQHQQPQPQQQQQQFVPQQYVQQPPQQHQQYQQQQQPQHQLHQHQQHSLHQQHQQHQQQHHQQHQHAINSMPPPTAPASKPTDPNDLADALTSAGIDLKEEEARLASGGGYASSYNVDPYTGLPLSSEDARRLEQRRRAADRANHIHDPFLSVPILSTRLLNKTQTENCTSFTLGDSSSSGQNMDIVALLSLACRERLNTLLTRSTALAKVRRRPQTQITGDWADCVEGVTPEIRLESAVSPRGNARKSETNYAVSFAESLLKQNPGVIGSFSSTNNLLPTASTPTSIVPTANLQNETAKALRALKQREWEADQERQRKKAKRENSGGTGGSGTATPGGGDTPTPGTPGGEIPGPKITAKESRKQQANKIEEAASHRAANATANMMMGGFGSKKKKKTYSWMNSGGPGAAAMGMGASRPGPAGGTGPIDTSTVQANTGSDLGNMNWTGQRLGVWREDGERGKGIQIRDWVGALEGDGRVGGKGIVRAYLRMK